MDALSLPNIAEPIEYGENHHSPSDGQLPPDSSRIKPGLLFGRTVNTKVTVRRKKGKLQKDLRRKDNRPHRTAAPRSPRLTGALTTRQPLPNRSTNEAHNPSGRGESIVPGPNLNPQSK